MLDILLIIKPTSSDRVFDFALQMRLHFLGGLGDLELWAMGKQQL